MVKHSSSNKIFNAIMKFSDFRIYKWIYRHPIMSIAFLVLMAVAILYIFVGFIIKYVV